MKYHLAVGAVLVSLMLGVRAEAALYAATSAGQPGELYIIDPASGAMLADIGPTKDALNVNYPITGLAFHPITGVLYGSTGNSVPATAARLVTIDPLTALVTVVGAFNVSGSTMSDLAFDAAGALYGVGSTGGPHLYSINLGTAQATLIGSSALTSTTGGGLAVAPDGSFYGTPTSTRFGEYDPNTGAYTNVGNPIKPNGGAYGALDYDGAGVLFGLNVGSGVNPPTALVTIDPLTAAIVSMGNSVNALDAIAFSIPEPGAMGVLLVPAVIAALSRRGRNTSGGGREVQAKICRSPIRFA